MAVMDIGHAAVSSGWRKQVADIASPRIAERVPAREPQVRALIGLGLFAIAALYVARTLRGGLD